VIVDRLEMAVQRDPFTQASAGAVRFHARKRVGGQVVLSEAIVKLKCAA
jgi:HK97 family phage major capsid protein